MSFFSSLLGVTCEKLPRLTTIAKIFPVKEIAKVTVVLVSCFCCVMPFLMKQLRDPVDYVCRAVYFSFPVLQGFI